jgi:UPF0755 protein
VKKTLLFFFVLLPLLALTAAGGFIYYQLNQSHVSAETNFTIHTGETFGKINQRLHDQNLIRDKRFFHHYSQYKGVLNKFRAGSFTIPEGANMKQVLEALIYGQPNLISVTIPEGKNMYEIAKLFAAAGITNEEDFLTAVQQPDLISILKIQASSLEGYLFPETYRFAANTPAPMVARAMIDLFNKKTQDLDFTHPFLNKHQVVILASVIEKETGAKFERPTISGVFTNRLKKRMRLQSDPTTIYGMWARYSGNIRKADLLEETPYNTYKIPALPIGPIANPSLEAIKAALNPEEHNFYYFVSKNDGTHIFSRTYQEHNQAVDQFQRNARAREGKSWRDLKQ